SGILSSASLPTIQAYIADSTPPEKRSVWIGIVIGMGFSFGFILGPAIGGILGMSPWPILLEKVFSVLPNGQRIIAADHLSYPAFLACVIALLNFMAAFRKLPESLSEEHRQRAVAQPEHGIGARLVQAMSHPQLGPMLLILWLSTFAMQN